MLRRLITDVCTMLVVGVLGASVPLGERAALALCAWASAAAADDAARERPAHEFPLVAGVSHTRLGPSAAR